MGGETRLAEVVRADRFAPAAQHRGPVGGAAGQEVALEEAVAIRRAPAGTGPAQSTGVEGHADAVSDGAAAYGVANPLHNAGPLVSVSYTHLTLPTIYSV